MSRKPRPGHTGAESGFTRYARWPSPYRAQTNSLEAPSLTGGRGHALARRSRMFFPWHPTTGATAANGGVLSPPGTPPPDGPLSEFLEEAGLKDDVLGRVREMLAQEDVTTVSLLRKTWPALRASIRVGPRYLLEEHLFGQANSDSRPAGPTRGNSIKTPKPLHQPGQKSVSPRGPVPLTRQLSPGHLDRRGRMGSMRLLLNDADRQQPEKPIETPMDTERGTSSTDTPDDTRDAIPVTAPAHPPKQWKVAKSAAEVVPITPRQATNDDELLAKGRMMSTMHQEGNLNFRRKTRLYEWRERGYAFHTLPIKDLIEWFGSAVARHTSRADQSELAAFVNGLSPVTARDLRMLDPHFTRKFTDAEVRSTTIRRPVDGRKVEGGRHSTKTKPLLVVRNSAVVCTVHKLNISWMAPVSPR